MHGAVAWDVAAGRREGGVRGGKGGGASSVEFGVRVGGRVKAGVGR